MIDRQPFGEADGVPVETFSLYRPDSTIVTVTNYGATIIAIRTPDRNGLWDDIILGYDTLKGYLQDTQYFGCMVGRCANRIGRGILFVDGVRYRLGINNGMHHLHGGHKGFNKHVWKVAEIRDREEPSVTFTYASADGEEGYPGRLQAHVTYSLSTDHELSIGVRARTDRATAVNLANHAYFNLGGQGSPHCLDHIVTLNADHYLPVSGDILPRGEIASVSGSPMDLTRGAVIGDRLREEDEQLRFAGGFDHNWVVRRIQGGEGDLVPAASALCGRTGRKLEVWTTQPGIQFYTGNFLNGTVHGKGNVPYDRHAGFCLEAQGFPDAPNRPQFPSVILKPGQTYRQTTQYRFYTTRPVDQE